MCFLVVYGVQNICGTIMGTFACFLYLFFENKKDAMLLKYGGKYSSV